LSAARALPAWIAVCSFSAAASADASAFPPASAAVAEGRGLTRSDYALCALAAALVPIGFGKARFS
jgi:hypothetical protein